MTFEDFNILTSDNILKIIAENIEQDPKIFALKQHNKIPHSQLISTQIKYLQKSRQKLPSYFNQLCILPPISYEQASSEETARLKDFSGEHCLDLCCGLGVDSYFFSKRFERVSSLELSPILSEIARYNFQKLGVYNVEVTNQAAEDFLQNYNGPQFDLIYADPARRDKQGKRLLLLEDCSPNVLALMPQMLKHAKKILLKLSPLFDIKEAFNKFPNLSNLHILSVKNECKELWVEINSLGEEKGGEVLVKLINKKTEVFRFQFEENNKIELPDIKPDAVKYILEPDVALYKARKVQSLFLKYFPSLKGSLNHSDGFFFCTGQFPENFPGRIFALKSFQPFNPKLLKKFHRQFRINQAHLIRRNFPISVTKLREKLQLKEGGDAYILFSQCQGTKTSVWYTERIQ